MIWKQVQILYSNWEEDTIIDHLEVGEMVGEPRHKSVKAGHIHHTDPLIEQLCGLGQHLHKHNSTLQQC